MSKYQVQIRRGSQGIYVATLDTYDLRLAHVACLQGTSETRLEHRIVQPAYGRIVRHYTPGGYDKKLKRSDVEVRNGMARVRETISALTIGSMSA